MSNVLTAEAKKKLGSRMRARVMFAVALVLACGGFVAALSLAPALIAVTTTRAALGAPSAETTAVREDQTKAARAQALIAGLKPLVGATTTPTALTTAALDAAPDGLSIRTIAYQAGSRVLTLTGIADRREAVSDFRDALEASGAFSNVVVPVAALVGTQEGRFTITLTGN